MPHPAATSVRRRPASPDPADFIRRHTLLAPVPRLPHIRLHLAHQATGLWRLAAAASPKVDPPPPYWAFPWAGGMALARYLAAHADLVAGKRVLDLGSGSGLVAIAAAMAGAVGVLASDIDPYAVAAIAANAAANGVAVTPLLADLTTGAPPDVDVVLVGDLFYEAALAKRVAAFLDRCRAAGAAVLVGDPHRKHLPAARLQLLAEYAVPDVGDVEGAAAPAAAVFVWV